MTTDIKTITSVEQEHIQRLIQRKHATDIDKLENEKFWFDRRINPNLNAVTKQTLFYEYFTSLVAFH